MAVVSYDEFIVMSNKVSTRDDVIGVYKLGSSSEHQNNFMLFIILVFTRASHLGLPRVHAFFPLPIFDVKQ